MSTQRFEKQRQFLQNRLSPEGYAGLHLTIGVLVVLLAGWWFGAIAEDLSSENPLVALTSYGFPSGHTMGVTVLFGLLALFLAKTVSTAGAAFAYFIAAGLVILLIGLTRVYLGAHFLSDVLGAFAASVVWLTFCWTAFETLRRRQKHRSE